MRARLPPPPPLGVPAGGLLVAEPCPGAQSGVFIKSMCPVSRPAQTGSRGLNNGISDGCVIHGNKPVTKQIPQRVLAPAPQRSQQHGHRLPQRPAISFPLNIKTSRKAYRWREGGQRLCGDATSPNHQKVIHLGDSSLYNKASCQGDVYTPLLGTRTSTKLNKH